MPMTLTLTPDIERCIRDRAATTGRDAEEYALMVLTRDVKRPTIDEILAPVRDQIAASGITDEELDEFFREQLRQVRAEHRAAKAAAGRP